MPLEYGTPETGKDFFRDAVQILPYSIPQDLESKVRTKRLDQDAIILTLSFSRLGDSVKADLDEIRTEAKKERIGVSKRLFVGEAFERIAKADAALSRQILKRWALPGGSVLPAGSYWLPLSLLSQVEQALSLYARQREEDIEGLFDDWENGEQSIYSREIEQARLELGPQFSASDYPSPAEARSRYRFSWRYLLYSLPSQLPPDLLAREEEKFRAANEQALAECKQVLLSSFSGFVSNLVARLTDKTTGKKAVFRESLIGNLQEFFSTFEARNLSQDATFAELVSRARRALADCPSSEVLKDAPALQTRLLNQFTEIEKVVSAELAPKARRVATLD